MGISSAYFSQLSPEAAGSGSATRTGCLRRSSARVELPIFPHNQRLYVGFGEWLAVPALRQGIKEACINPPHSDFDRFREPDRAFRGHWSTSERLSGALDATPSKLARARAQRHELKPRAAHRADLPRC